jgi:hypothetical protein
MKDERKNLASSPSFPNSIFLLPMFLSKVGPCFPYLIESKARANRGAFMTICINIHNVCRGNRQSSRRPPWRDKPGCQNRQTSPESAAAACQNGSEGQIRKPGHVRRIGNPRKAQSPGRLPRNAGGLDRVETPDRCSPFTVRPVLSPP